MNAFKLLTWIFVLSTLISGCRKPEDAALSSNGTFSFTKASGKTYTTKYVNIPIPTSLGTFSLQYKKVGTFGSDWNFLALFDNNNDFGLTFQIPKIIINGTTYTTIGQKIDSGISPTIVSFYGYLDKEDFTLLDTKTNLIFEKSTYPGPIIGSFTVYNNKNKALIGSGKFNFVAK